MKTRICNKCNKDLPLTDFYFYKNKSKLEGFERDCKECFKKRRMDNYYTPEGKEKNRLSSTKSKRKIVSEHPERALLWAATQRANKKGIECSISINDIIIPTHCPILGIPLFRSKKYMCPNSPSLDRIDNTKGYSPGNIIVISWRANALKKDASLEEIEKVYNFMKNNLRK